MKLLIYGTNACPDCVNATKALDEKGIKYLYLEFSESIGNLKRFLKIRDTNSMFDPVKANGGVGVPLFVFEDGTMTFELEDVLKRF